MFVQKKLRSTLIDHYKRKEVLEWDESSSVDPLLDVRFPTDEARRF